MTERNFPENEIPTETEKSATSLANRVERLRELGRNKRTRVAAIASAAVVGLGLTAAMIASGSHTPAGATAAAAADSRTVGQHADRADRKAPSKAAAKPKAIAPKKAAAKPKPAAWVTPMAKFELTSCYGPRWGTMHEGIDFANVPGTPIRAAGAGTVIAAGWNAGGYGNMVIVQHGPNLYTLYGHASRIAVHAGQHVGPGQTVSYEGATGDAQGPHLHFEVWNNMWSRIEPAKFLRDHGVKIGC